MAASVLDIVVLSSVIVGWLLFCVAAPPHVLPGRESILLGFSGRNYSYPFLNVHTPQSYNRSALYWLSISAFVSELLITESCIGRLVNIHQTISIPIKRHMKLHSLCKFMVGPKEMDLPVLGNIIFSGLFSLCVYMYTPKSI